MGLFKRKRKPPEDETAATVAAELYYDDSEEVEEDDVAENKRESKKNKNFFKNLGGFIDTARNVSDTATEIYNVWIKPVHDNWAQIKRRLNAISTIISIIFFVLYIPFLLFGKIATGLDLGWEVALYVCIGVYVVTIVSLLIVTLATGKSTSTDMAKSRKKLSKIIMFVVRLASLAIAITAVAIAGGASTSALNTLAMIFAIFSIIFSALPLLFGGMAGFFKWLISPAKIKRTFSFVLLEWFQILTDENTNDKKFKLLKKNSKKYRDDISRLIDDTLIPALGKKKIETVRTEDITAVLDKLENEEKIIAGWIVFNTFTYAVGCGYITENPCADLGTESDMSALKIKRTVKE